MCIAIYKKENIIIPKETLAECYRRNPDGAGFMIIENDTLKIRKGYFTFESFYHEFKKVESKQALIHFRIKTHGKVSEANCHPFFVTNELGFIHNGIISKHGSNAELSDTRDFNIKILKPLVKKYGTTIIENKEIQTMMKEYIGYSKLVFLNKEGKATIINEVDGNWDNEIWYSNHTWKPYTQLPQTKYSGKEYGKGYGYIDDDDIWNYQKKETKKQITRLDNTKWYIRKENNEIINEDDTVRIGANCAGIPPGSLIKVIYINRHAICDVALANGTIVPNIAGRTLFPATPTGGILIGNNFDMDFTKEQIENGFSG